MKASVRRVDAPLWAFFTILVLFFLALGGWIANIVKLVKLIAADGGASAMLIGRIVGVFAMPLGSILGFF